MPGEGGAQRSGASGMGAAARHRRALAPGLAPDTGLLKDLPDGSKTAVWLGRSSECPAARQWVSVASRPGLRPPLPPWPARARRPTPWRRCHREPRFVGVPGGGCHGFGRESGVIAVPEFLDPRSSM